MKWHKCNVKAMPFKKAVKTIIDMTQKEIGEELENYQVCVLSAQNMDRAKELKQLLKQYANYDILEIPFQVGVTIGSHAGPTALGICYIKKYNCI